tara:strand:- start:704 stop:2203 length:1500 start_codon:yes stop_codon:yes gene_type:complete
MPWNRLGTTTLSSTGSPITVSGFGASTFIQELHHGIESGSYGSSLRLNNDSGTKYANRRRQNGAAENSNGNRTFIENVYGGDTLMISFMGDIDGEEKMIINLGGFSGSSGAGNAPNRLQLVGKYVPSPTARISQVNRFDSEGGAHGVDTNLTVLGSDVILSAMETNVPLGTRFEETDTRKIYYRADSERSTDKWFLVGTAFPTSGLYAVFGGGYIGSNNNTIDYITIQTTGNATDFGDMNTSRRGYGACASMTRGLFAGGYSSDYLTNIEYITIATPSNGTSFGDMGDNRTFGATGTGSETRGLFAGGESPYTNRIAYVTIASTGNSTDFGDLTQTGKGGGSTSDGTTAVFMGRENSETTMDYVTIATTGNASNWGNLSSGSNSAGAGNVNNGTRGVMALGQSSNTGNYINNIEYITMASAGNAVDFGDLTQGRASPMQSSTDTRGVFGGGKYQSGGSSGTVTIDYITIATTGNATDFGDLTSARYMGGSVSDQGGDRT